MRRLIVGFAAGFLLSPAVAEAHIGLESSDPEKGATVEAPEDITFYFDGPIEDYNDIMVQDKQGNEVKTTDVSLEPEDQLNVSMEAPLEAGEYEASFEVVSEDGHIIEGSSSFIAEEAPEATNSSDEASSDNKTEGAEESAEGQTDSGVDEEESGSNIPLALIGLGLVAVIVVLFLVRLKRRS